MKNQQKIGKQVRDCREKEKGAYGERKRVRENGFGNCNDDDEEEKEVLNRICIE